MDPMLRIYSSRDEVEVRLGALGLDLEILLGAAMASEVARSRATANHPPITGGFNGWADGVAALRDGLLPLGWRKSDSRGYSTVISPDGSRRIAVASGDRDTGVATGRPRTRSPKGPATIQAVAHNQQLSLLEGLGIDPDIPAEDDAGEDDEIPRETWILLIARHRDELRAELSRPATMDDEDRVATWLERIILPLTNLGEPPSQSALPPTGVGPDFDVTVTRRVG